MKERGRERGPNVFDRLLIDERPLMVQPTLAVIFGLVQAVILQEIFWLLKQPRSGRVIERVELPDGRVFEGLNWIWNTSEQWREYFSWLPVDSIRKHLASLEDNGVLVSYQPANRDRTKHYTIDREALDMWVAGWYEGECTREDAMRRLAQEGVIPSGKNRRMQAAKHAACIRQPVESLQPAIFAASSIKQNLHTECSSREEGGASRAATSAPDMPIPDALKAQPAPPRKPRAPKLSPTNITASDDPRIAAYLEHLRSEITRSNAALICERVKLEYLAAWIETCKEWAYGNGDASWNPTNFAGMFERYDRKLTARRAKVNGHRPTPKTKEQPQQFGVGGEWYQAAQSLGWDLSELTKSQEVGIGN